jgi:hypothetical protein
LNPAFSTTREWYISMLFGSWSEQEERREKKRGRGEEDERHPYQWGYMVDSCATTYLRDNTPLQHTTAAHATIHAITHTRDRVNTMFKKQNKTDSSLLTCTAHPRLNDERCEFVPIHVPVPVDIDLSEQLVCVRVLESARGTRKSEEERGRV